MYGLQRVVCWADIARKMLLGLFLALKGHEFSFLFAVICHEKYIHQCPEHFLGTRQARMGHNDVGQACKHHHKLIA